MHGCDQHYQKAFSAQATLTPLPHHHQPTSPPPKKNEPTLTKNHPLAGQHTLPKQNCPLPILSHKIVLFAVVSVTVFHGNHNTNKKKKLWILKTLRSKSLLLKKRSKCTFTQKFSGLCRKMEESLCILDTHG